MEKLKNEIEKQTEKQGICYHGDSGNEVNDSLKDVNKSWSNFDFILTNSKITVGVNFDKERFDRVYLALAGFSSPRDVIQASYRIRNLADNEVIATILNLNKFSSIDESHRVKDKNFKKLVNDLVTEDSSPIIQTFKLFSHKAHYTFVDVPIHLNKKEEKAYLEYLQTDDTYYSWNAITCIHEKYEKILKEGLEKNPLDIHIEEEMALNKKQEIEEIKSRIYAGCAAMEDILMMQKFYFQKLFNKKTSIHKIAKAWDNKYIEFVQKYLFFFNIKIKQNIPIAGETSKMKKILDKHKLTLNSAINEIKNCILTDKDKEEINDYILDDQKLNNSSPIKYISKLINTYFSGYHIVYKQTKSRHGEFVRTKKFNKIISFCKKNIYDWEEDNEEVLIIDDIDM